ncbi:MAG TPA: hypothetical protein VFQ79_11600 [Bryobacteraceae bacterium]|nr:hypothetical protein [Bryobacteraceae bacterium]
MGTALRILLMLLTVAGFSLASESIRICYPDGVFRFGSPVSTADKGFILSRAFESVDGSAPNVWVYDREGKAVTSAILWLEDAAKVRVFDVGVDYDGTAVASGYVTRADGTAEAVIGIIGRGGRIERVIRTNPFVARFVTVGPDRVIWAAGRDIEATQRGRDYDMVRSYSMDGRFLHSAVPRSSAASVQDPVPATGKTGRTHLRGSSTNVVFYSGVMNRLIVFDRAGAIVNDWSPPVPWRNARMGGFGTDAASIYALFRGDDGHRGAFRFDRQAGNWVLIKDTYTPPGERVRFGLLRGTDAGALVFTNRKMPESCVTRLPVPGP